MSKVNSLISRTEETLNNIITSYYSGSMRIKQTEEPRIALKDVWVIYGEAHINCSKIKKQCLNYQ